MTSPQNRTEEPQKRYPKRLQKLLEEITRRRRSSEGQVRRSKSHSGAAGELPRGPQSTSGASRGARKAPKMTKKQPKRTPKRSQDHQRRGKISPKEPQNALKTTENAARTAKATIPAFLRVIKHPQEPNTRKNAGIQPTQLQRENAQEHNPCIFTCDSGPPSATHGGPEPQSLHFYV